MAAAAAGMGDTEVAYCLYAKGYAQCSTATAAAAVSDAAVHAVVQQLAAGQLQMLAALCEVPQDHLQQQQQQQSICKRWQRMKERFQLAPSSSSSSSSSRKSTQTAAASRVLCVSDLHVDKAGGANMAWLQRISSSAFSSDVLIVAGAPWLVAVTSLHAAQLVTMLNNVCTEREVVCTCGR
jgi:hypothetical protein